MSQKEKVLLFGPCGNVGRDLLPLLEQMSDLEICLAYHHTKPSVEKERISLVQVDLRQPETLTNALAVSSPTKIVFMLPTVSNTHPLVVNFVNALKSVSLPQLNHVIYISEGDIDDFLQTQLNCYDNVMDSFKLMMVTMQKTADIFTDKYKGIWISCHATRTYWFHAKFYIILWSPSFFETITKWGTNHILYRS